MNKKEIEKLKTILKPVVKECIREAIFEEGVLSTLVAEIVVGMGADRIVETKAPEPKVERRNAAAHKAVNETKNKMLSAIAESGYANLGGVNVFEGTEPLSKGGNPNNAPSASPLANIDPRDKGVDIDSLVGLFGSKWNALK
tara:strand:- start:2390 stop:2815 length:426 start_codon:yes stop_codon:yes gene_type:complete